MNIKDFLIDNYIWIIVIILITIITIIGFLADRKKSNKKQEEMQPANPNLNNVQQPNMGQLQYGQPFVMQQEPQNNMGNNLVNNQMVTPVDNTMQNPNTMNNVDYNNVNYMNQTVQAPIIEQSTPTMTMPMEANVNNMPTPVELNVQNVVPEPAYQPLSEQKPSFAPQPVPNFQNVLNTPESQMPVDNSLNQNMQTNPYNMNMSMPNIQQQTPQLDALNTQMIGVVPEFNQNNGNITNMVNTIPVPQQVIPQPIMNTSIEPMNEINYSNNQNINTTIPTGVPVQNVPQPMSMPQPTPVTISQNVGMNYNEGFPQQPMNGQNVQNNVNQQSPVNFVYGPQNSNPNM